MNHALKYAAVLGLICAFAMCSLLGQNSNHSSPKQTSVTEGAAIFRKSCALCHSMRPGEVKIGPSLAGVLRRGSDKSDQAARQIIADGKGNMPAFKDKLTPKEISQVIEFLKSSP